MDRRDTESLCPQCFSKIPARLVAFGDNVYMEKTCPEHGKFKTILWRGEPKMEEWRRPKIPAPIHYPNTQVEKGCPFDCGICPEHRQHTCTALLEVTMDCDIRCPVCFADGGKPQSDASIETIRSWYRMLLDSGGPYNIQISGGEPTVRDDLPEIIAMGRSMGFPFIQLNTNGLRLSREPEFLSQLIQAGLSSLFLQFDGTTGGVHEKLRGDDYLAAKLSLLDHCRELGLGVILVPTVVPGVNDGQLWSIVELGLKAMPTVRGVHFQPISYFGRYPEAPTDCMRMTLPEIMRGLEEQSGGKVVTSNFAPPGCENALCSFHGNFVFMDDGSLIALTRRETNTCSCQEAHPAEVGAAKARAFVARNWRMQCSCQDNATESGRDRVGADSDADGTATVRIGSGSGRIVDSNADGTATCSGTDKAADRDSLDVFLERARTHLFCLSAMAFQDVWNVDLERLRDCCIHVVSQDGKRIPFCAYNLTASRGEPLYRK